MTTLAEMRAEVAREHGWHLDDDGDRIDAELNERFGQAAVEMYEALERAQSILDRLVRPKEHQPSGSEITSVWAEAIASEFDARKAMAMARGQS